MRNKKRQVNNRRRFATDERERELLSILWQQGPLSRWELHEKCGRTPNAVGQTVGRLLRKHLVRERAAGPSSGGRPRVPLELDGTKWHVVGLLIAPGAVEVCRINLHGERVEESRRQEVARPRRIVAAAEKLLKETVNDQTLLVGVSATGFVDAQAHALLLSSAAPGMGPVSLEPIYRAAGGRPLVLANDMQAVAARWMLTHRAQANQDILLVGLGEGSIGAAMLIEGRPNRGCVMAGNELGHTRLPVMTERCFCGQTGCLERIFTTDFMRRHGLAGEQTMRAALGSPAQAAVKEMGELLAMGISNSANFVRPHRLVLVGEVVRFGKFCQWLLTRIRSMLLEELQDRVRVEVWVQSTFRTSESAGWAALASLYAQGWEARFNPAAARARAAE